MKLFKGLAKGIGKVFKNKTIRRIALEMGKAAIQSQVSKSPHYRTFKLVSSQLKGLSKKDQIKTIKGFNDNEIDFPKQKMKLFHDAIGDEMKGKISEYNSLLLKDEKTKKEFVFNLLNESIEERRGKK